MVLHEVPTAGLWLGLKFWCFESVGSYRRYSLTLRSGRIYESLAIKHQRCLLICMHAAGPIMWFSFEQTLCPWGKPLNKPYRYLPFQQVGFLRLFGLKTEIDFAQFGLESGVVFAGTMWVYERIYRFNSKWVRKKGILNWCGRWPYQRVTALTRVFWYNKMHGFFAGPKKASSNSCGHTTDFLPR